MAEVVDIQAIKMHRKSSQGDKMGLCTRNENATGTIPRLPPIRRSNEAASPSSQSFQYKRNRKKITISLIKKKSDVNANEVDEEKHVYGAKNEASDSPDLHEDSPVDQKQESYHDDEIKESSLSNTEEVDERNSAAQDSDSDDGTTSKTSSYSISYPSYSRESSTMTIPFDCGSIEGIGSFVPVLNAAGTFLFVFGDNTCHYSPQ